MFFVLFAFIFAPLILLLSLLFKYFLSMEGFGIFFVFIISNILTAFLSVIYARSFQTRTQKDIIDITRVEDEIRYWVNLRNEINQLATQPTKIDPTPSTTSTSTTSTSTTPTSNTTEEKSPQQTPEQDIRQIEDIRQDIETNLTAKDEKITNSELPEQPRRRSRKDD